MVQPKTLLIVDDEEALLDVLASEFKNLGFRCLTASEPSLALEMVRSEQPDCILSDINMPGMSGLAMLKKLREQKIETPVIFLTGYADKDKIAEALRLGAIDFLEKPFPRDVLRASVTKGIELGFRLRHLESELDTFMKKMKLSSKLKAQYREIKKVLLLNQKRNQMHFKKSS